MKNTLVFILLVLSSISGWTQSTPLYVCDTVQPTSLGAVSGSHIPLNTGRNIAQCIYLLSDFPGMPAQGQITDVYIPVSDTAAKGTKLHGLTIKMKPTGKNAFPMSMALNNQIETGLTTVYYDSVYVLQDSLFPGDWIRLTLPVPYNYSFVPGADSSKNLIVEVSQDSIKGINTYVYQYTPSFSGTRWLNTGHHTSTVAVGYFLLVLGFNPKPDPPPLGVSGTDKNREWVVYPNPAKDRVYLPKKGTYQVYDMKGQQVLEVTIANDNTIDVSILPTGVYIIRSTENNIVYRFTKE